jgi:hypothetical protein
VATKHHPRARATRRDTGLAAIGLAVVSLLMLSWPQTAHAVTYRYVAVNVITTSNALGGEIARCHISYDGGSCTITRGKTAERTISAQLGATRAEIAASLGISTSTSVTTTVGCNSPALRAGQTWRARAMGTRYSYHVAQQEMQRPRVGPTRWVTTRTSANRTSAFNPAANQISCGL